MERMKLSVETREGAGKGLNKMRSTGLIPGIIYGEKQKPLMIRIGEKDLETATRTQAGFNAIFDLTLDGKSAGLARIIDYQADPIRRKFLHVDFKTVDLKEKVIVEVPVRFIGKSEGVKEGGVLEILRRELELRCPVTAIPEHIEVDIATLMIGDNIHADDLKLPEGVEFPHETNFTVCAVVPPKKEEEVAPAVEAVPAEGAVAEGAPAAEGEAKAAEGEGKKQARQTTGGQAKEEGKKA